MGSSTSEIEALISRVCVLGNSEPGQGPPGFRAHKPLQTPLPWALLQLAPGSSWGLRAGVSLQHCPCRCPEEEASSTPTQPPLPTRVHAIWAEMMASPSPQAPAQSSEHGTVGELNGGTTEAGLSCSLSPGLTPASSLPSRSLKLLWSTVPDFWE